jgi:hypothetical protein
MQQHGRRQVGSRGGGLHLQGYGLEVVHERSGGPVRVPPPHSSPRRPTTRGPHRQSHPGRHISGRTSRRGRPTRSCGGHRHRVHPWEKSVVLRTHSSLSAASQYVSSFTSITARPPFVRGVPCNSARALTRGVRLPSPSLRRGGKRGWMELDGHHGGGRCPPFP